MAIQEKNRKEIFHGLAQGNPWEIEEYMQNQWKGQVHAQIADIGSEIVVPDGWHGAGKRGDAQVLFGDVLTKKISGTELTPFALTQWLDDKGFTFENSSPIIASEITHSSGTPIVRAVRVGSGVPIVIEVFHGSQANEVKMLSAIGNIQSDLLTDTDKRTYRGIVTQLIPFLSIGSTKVKERMGIPMVGKKLRRIDDCAAAYTSIAADMLLDDERGIAKPNLDEVGVAIATSHSLVEAVTLADMRQVPLFIRIGAPSFGLLPPPDTNYMANTQKDMLAIGRFTSGDFGTIMSSGKEQYDEPHIRLYGSHDPNNETRFYLNGGGPVQEIMSEQYERRKKPYHGIVTVLRASRIDNGPSNWGVIFKGKALSIS
jgi:hypothetical protein